MQTVTVKSLDRLQQLVLTDRHAIVADEPPDVGDGLGPLTPMSCSLRR